MVRASVVVPAHQEGAVIGRLLSGLVDPRLEVIVVVNASTDDTAARARAVPGVRVIEVAEPGKQNALRVGDAATVVFPRVYVDADVRIDADSVIALVDALERRGLHLTGPARRMPLARSSAPVRWYTTVWQDLPHVRSGLFGRGVMALSAAGHARLADLGGFTADDLVFAEAFGPGESAVVEEAIVVVQPARTLGALVRRRIRAAAGTEQAAEAGRVAHRTGLGDLAAQARRGPVRAGKVAVFLGVTVAARVLARTRRGRETWWRDETSRAD